MKKSWLHFHTILERDGQTDGHVEITVTCASIASWGQKLHNPHTVRLKTSSINLPWRVKSISIHIRPDFSTVIFCLELLINFQCFILLVCTITLPLSVHYVQCSLMHFACRSDQTSFIAFLPARRYASAGNSDRHVSVCLSVCPSVTCRYCVKTKKAGGMISSPSGSPKTLVFWRQI